MQDAPGTTWPCRGRRMAPDARPTGRYTSTACRACLSTRHRGALRHAAAALCVSRHAVRTEHALRRQGLLRAPNAGCRGNSGSSVSRLALRTRRARRHRRLFSQRRRGCNSFCSSARRRLWRRRSGGCLQLRKRFAQRRPSLADALHRQVGAIVACGIPRDELAGAVRTLHRSTLVSKVPKRSQARHSARPGRRFWRRRLGHRRRRGSALHNAVATGSDVHDERRGGSASLGRRRRSCSNLTRQRRRRLAARRRTRDLRLRRRQHYAARQASRHGQVWRSAFRRDCHHAAAASLRQATRTTAGPVVVIQADAAEAPVNLGAQIRRLGAAAAASFPLPRRRLRVRPRRRPRRRHASRRSGRSRGPQPVKHAAPRCLPCRSGRPAPAAGLLRGRLGHVVGPAGHDG